MLAGLITVSLRGTTAVIGLVSTAPTQRGTGVGAALLAASHRWATTHGAERIEVATQRENAAACGLYERAGYAAAEVGDYYHFLL
jgi:GNAT superfamily N-acetyltransferase